MKTLNRFNKVKYQIDNIHIRCAAHIFHLRFGKFLKFNIRKC